MSKKRDRSPGLEYMISLDFKPERTYSGVERRLLDVCDRKTVETIMYSISKRADGKTDDSSFYKLKNQTSKISMALTSAFDADILRKACNWIADHQDLFGETILEVGCDCGVMSCFLAKTFPESKITAIDRCAEAVVNAKELANKLNLSNITFIACDLKDLSGTFNTVFSMRTMHENHNSNEDVINDLSVQAEIFKDGLLDYAKLLQSKVEESGVLVSIERIGRNALLLGWIEALFDAGLVFGPRGYDELICNEVGEESEFQAFVALQKAKLNAQGLSPKDLFDLACQKYLDYSLASYGGWDAKIVYENRRGELIEGYLLEFPHPARKCKMAVWTHATDPTGLVVYFVRDNDVYLIFTDKSEKEAVLKGFADSIAEAKQFDPTVKVTKLK